MNATVSILLVALFFAGMGLLALARPARITALFGTPSLTVDGRSEVRAVYGGFGLAVAGLLVFALQAPAWRAGICLTVAVALVGMAVGRLLSLLIDGRPGPMPLLFIGVELGLAALLECGIPSGIS